MEVEGHEVYYVSAPKWRHLFLGSGCNNNYYVYTESLGIKLHVQMANTPLMQNPRHYLLIKKPRELAS